MERAAGFDLERAVGEWRAGFTHLADDELDELVDHLREEFVRLAALGLTPEEAWLIARRRLGQKPALEDEFIKLDATRRVFTFLLGYFAVTLCLGMAGTLSAGALTMSKDLGTLAYVAVSVGWLLVSSIALLRILPRLAHWLPERALRSPGRTLATLLACSAALGLCEMLFYRDFVADPAQHDPSRFVIVQSSVLVLLGCVVLLTLWVAARDRQLHRRVPRGLWASRVHESRHRG